MKATLSQRALDAGAKAVHLGCEVERLKTEMSDAVSVVLEDGVDAAKRAAKRGLHKAQDLTDEAAYRIKRNPLRSVVLGVGIGLGIGTLLGWLASRSRRNGSGETPEA